MHWKLFRNGKNCCIERKKIMVHVFSVAKQVSDWMYGVQYSTTYIILILISYTHHIRMNLHYLVVLLTHVCCFQCKCVPSMQTLQTIGSFEITEWIYTISHNLLQNWMIESGALFLSITLNLISHLIVLLYTQWKNFVATCWILLSAKNIHIHL